jgi:hypothetical protein
MNLELNIQTMLIVKAFNVVAREGLILRQRKSLLNISSTEKKTKSRNPLYCNGSKIGFETKVGSSATKNTNVLAR